MDCGDAGHVLLSKYVADDIDDYPEWRPYLHDLGECEVKHGVRVHLFNLYGNDFGNPAVPAKVQSAAKLERKRSRTPWLIAAGAPFGGRSRAGPFSRLLWEARDRLGRGI